MVGGTFMKVVVLLKNGFEELEALSVVDILRRAQVECQMIGMDSQVVTGSHQIALTTDQIFNEDVYEADVVVLPGGMPGSTSLKDDERVIQLIKNFAENGKWVAAICAAPIVLNQAGLLKGKNYTCYPGFEKGMEGTYHDAMTCVDGHVITARGPGAALAFGYEILEQIGVCSQQLKNDMQYRK